MHASHKKLILILLLVTTLTGLLVWRQINRAYDITVRPSTETVISLETYDIPVLPDDPILGNPGAPVTIIEFGDLTSNQGRDLHKLLAEFTRARPQQVRLVWKDAPRKSIFSRHSFLIHQAALCAAPDNKFWEYVDALLELNKKADITALNAIAESIKVDLPRWTGCTTAAATQEKVATDAAVAQALGIKKPPALFINNRWINLNEEIDLPQLLKSLGKQE